MAKDKTPRLVDHVAESSDEEIDEDLAFNSDDERMYGSLFMSDKNNKSKRKRRDEDDSDSDDDDSIVNDGDDDDGSDASDGIASDDDDGDGGQFMLDLLNNLDKKEESNLKEEKKEMRAALAHTSKIAESEFSSTAVKSSNLTLDQLVNGITDTKGFKSVKNAMRDMTSEIYENDTSSRLSTTKTPVAKIISERAERKVNYEEQSENVSEWTQSVKKNREAETLDFRPKERIRMNNAKLVQKFTPTTDFEKEMAAALEEAGASDEKDIMAKEEEEMFGDDDDDLGRNKLSPEEYRKRLGELSKMRALMFYEEQKRHHINKIKSKKYRKIRKKQRLRKEDEEEQEAAENDEELARELDEKAEMERMKERMSLKHRNTSKWAKRTLRRGGNVDVETRRALSEQIRKGDELRKKMVGQYGDDDEEEEIDLIAQARNILADTEITHEEKTKSGIFQLAFMKKGIEAQRTRAKEEARELLKELEGNESGMESDSDNEEEGDEKRTKKRTASKKEMSNVLDKGKLVASSLKFGNSNSVQVTGDIDLGLKEMPSTQTKSDNVKTISLSTPHSIDEEIKSDKATTTVSHSKKMPTTTEKVATGESNPWLIPDANKNEENDTNKSTTKKKKSKSKASVSKQGIVNVADAINIISGETQEEETETNEVEKSSGKDAASDSKIASLSQEELVRKAFATPNVKDIEDEFEKEKDSMRTRDDHSKKQNESKFVSGWGSWAGEGAPAPKPPRKLPKRMAPPEKKIKRRKRQDDGKKDVIINAKRIKKTAKFQLENIPYPYKSREQYERAMAGAIGKEWNVTSAVKNMTRAAVVTRAGKMIKPMSKSAKMKRAPAKF